MEREGISQREFWEIMSELKCHMEQKSYFGSKIIFWLNSRWWKIIEFGSGDDFACKQVSWAGSSSDPGELLLQRHKGYFFFFKRKLV